jgi:hypothetical protein
MKIDLSDPLAVLILGVIASLIAAVIFVFIKYVLKNAIKPGVIMLELFELLWQRTKEKTGLETYRQTLEERTLRISHPWMKEKQTLTNILVPINFETQNATQREELEVYLAQEFKKNRALRLLILGKPGSGKTIAMRVIARSLWTFNEEIPEVPILMNFSDIKGITDHEGLKKKIIETLKVYQFGHGKKSEDTAEKFVEDNLYNGKLFLLFDGYDELDKSSRKSAAKLLENFLNTYPQIPAAISSRTALYQSELAFDKLKPCKISMAPFTPFAILKFLALWKFEGKKSSHDLFEMINGKAHLSELASNPLMLTIITFLYSTPKYTLPDKRAEFYEQCTRALLEEWDRAKQTDRANKYESHQKTAVLSRLAFEHVSASDINDELIHEDVVHRIVKEEMERLSLKIEEYPLMEKEILQNSGLIQSIPPKYFRFPHRTFMEFFTASYLDKEKNFRDMLELYYQDPEKWKEVLLLYMGLNENKEYANGILEDLIADFKNDFINRCNPNLILFSTLTQCAVPNPYLAKDILELAYNFLKKNPEKEVIEELGFIAANPRWLHAKRAKKILLEMLEWQLPDDAFQQVIFSILHTGDESLDELILDNLKRINLAEFLSKIGPKQKSFLHKLFLLRLQDDEKRKIILGLKEAGNFEILGHLMVENSDENIKELAAYALFLMSKLDGFHDFLDKTEIEFLDEKTRKEVDAKFEEWGWRWEFPKTRNGKKLAVLICSYSANWIAKNQKKGKKSLDQVDNLFRYLTTGFLVEKGIPFHEFNLIGYKEKMTATKWGLKRHWIKEINLNDFLNNSLEGFSVLTFIALFFMHIIGIVGFVQYQAGNTTDDFYRFFFDPFTVYIIFFLSILLFVIFIIGMGNLRKYNHWMWALLIPGGYISFSGFIGSIMFTSLTRICCVVLSAVLSIASLFLPFHTIIYNIIFFLWFILLGLITIEAKRCDFEIIRFFGNIKYIYNFLHEPESSELEL